MFSALSFYWRVWFSIIFVWDKRILKLINKYGTYMYESFCRISNMKLGDGPHHDWWSWSWFVFGHDDGSKRSGIFMITVAQNIKIAILFVNFVPHEMMIMMIKLCHTCTSSQKSHVNPVWHFSFFLDPITCVLFFFFLTPFPFLLAKIFFKLISSL